MNAKIIVGLGSGFLLWTAAPWATAQEPAAAPASGDASASGSASLGTEGASSEGDAAASGEKSDKDYEPQDMEFTMGASLGLMFPASDHNLRHEDERIEEYGLAFGGALRFGFHPIRYAGLEVEGAWMHTSVDNDSSAALFAGRAHAMLQFPIGRIVPFAVVGLGALGAGSNSMGTDTDPAFHFGLGLKYAVTEVISARLDLRDTMSQRSSTATEPAEDGDLTHFPEVLLGVSVALDARHPECEAAPPPPKDTDKDGFVDPNDKCPMEAGIAPEGCPDKDSDGDTLLDSKDVCPTEAGPATRGGCPVKDMDKDGTPDDCDKCPTEPGPLNGCPDLDADRDGINTPEDKCPDKAEIKNGFDDEDGCPDEIPEKVRKFNGVVKGIEFETGKDKIKPVSDSVLHGALIALQEYPKMRIEISGHTDNQGTAEANIDLSKRRAESVKKWFVDKGIDEKRMETRGAGPSEPIADNKGPEGRQKNRRIEFKLLQ